jgi:hypothetical protein
MVSQLQYRSPGQGAPHQHPKKIAARSMAIAAYNVIVRMNVPVWMDVTLRMRVAVRMRPAILRCIGQRSPCRFRLARILGSTITESLLPWLPPCKKRRLGRNAARERRTRGFARIRPVFRQPDGAHGTEGDLVIVWAKVRQPRLRRGRQRPQLLDVTQKASDTGRPPDFSSDDRQTA